MRRAAARRRDPRSAKSFVPMSSTTRSSEPFGSSPAQPPKQICSRVAADAERERVLVGAYGGSPLPRRRTMLSPRNRRAGLCGAAAAARAAATSDLWCSFQPSGDGMKPASPTTCGALGAERAQAALRAPQLLRRAHTFRHRWRRGGDRGRRERRGRRARRDRDGRARTSRPGGAGISRRTAHASRWFERAACAGVAQAREGETRTRGSDERATVCG